MKKLSRRFVILATLTLILILVLVWMGIKSLQNPIRHSVSREAPWTQSQVEARWNKTPSPFAVGPYWIEHGWDSTGLFYAAVPDRPGTSQNVTIVDRMQARECTLGTANWVQAEFEDGRYKVFVWSQYGWNATTFLDLATWEVTFEISGSCFQSMSCTAHKPPKVENQGECKQGQVYGPAGNY